MRWFNLYLKGIRKEDEKPIRVEARKFFMPEQLRVFDTLPADAINASIADTFVPVANPEKKSADQLRAELRKNVFSGWPNDNSPVESKQAFTVTRDGLKFSAWDFTSQHDVQLRLYLLEKATGKSIKPVTLYVLNQPGWDRWIKTVGSKFGAELTNELAGLKLPEPDSSEFEKLKREVTKQHAVAFFAPRGVGLTAWSGDEKRFTRIRRRFMLLGQTLDGMRVWDIRRAIQAVHVARKNNSAKIELQAEDTMAVNALYAALFESSVNKLELVNLPKSHIEGPDYLGILKLTDIPKVKDLVTVHTELKINSQ
jgi:hypothetical protein